MATRDISRLALAATGALLTTLLAASRAEAVLYAYEGFSYNPGPLDTLEGGTGFSGGWIANSGRPENVVEGSLGYTDSVGNVLDTNGNSILVAGDDSGASNGYRELNLPDFLPISTGTTWFSFVGRRLTPHDDPASEGLNVHRATGLQLHDSLSGVNNPFERISVGKGTTGPAGGLPEFHDEWSILHSAAVGQSDFAEGTKITDQAFLVLRINHIGEITDPDEAYLWVNPRLDQEPQIADADATLTSAATPPGSSDYSFSRVRYFVGGTTGAGPWAEFAMDEIRIATTFAEVAPFIPPVGEDDADFDGNGVVDGHDFSTWQRNLGTGTTLQTGDANGDGAVNAQDLAVWKAQFGPRPGISAVPEPGVLSLTAISVLACVRWRRRL